jgi:hypothetical protein
LPERLESVSHAVPRLIGAGRVGSVSAGSLGRLPLRAQVPAQRHLR